MCTICDSTDIKTTIKFVPNDVCTGLFEMIVGLLTTCHTQYT